MAGWIADFFRLVWALFYWNSRKSLYRWRGGRCPCQTASDSGLARETHCEASAMWARPVRFQRVCPLLVETPAGLRCSVDAADVRSFWGLALRYAGSGLLAVWLIGTLAAFVALRSIGYPVSYFAVVWPPAWSRIDEARGRYFLAKGRTALAANQTREALFSLALAHTLAPHDYDIGFTLASLWQINQPALSDQIYAQLLQEHPEAEAPVADAWHRALLARGDFGQVKLLAVREFSRADAAHEGYWMNSLLFAARLTRDPGPLQHLLKAQPAPAPAWRKVLELELLLHAGQVEQAIPGLRRAWPDANHPFIPYYQAGRLIDLGRARAALELIDAYGTRMRDDERFDLRLRAYAELGWASLLASDVELLLGPPPTSPVIELLGTHLARNPDPAILRRVFARLREAPLALTAENHGAFAALFCAAGVARDFDRMHEMAGALRKINGTPVHASAALEDFFRGTTAQRRLEDFLPAVPLPLELTYVMLARYSAGAPAAQK